MTDFGHFGTIGPDFCIDAWGAGPFEIWVGDRLYRFEDSDRFGPSLISKGGDILKGQLTARSPFWNAHLAWVRQGRRTDGIKCIWEPLKDRDHLGQSVYQVGEANGSHRG